MLYFAYGSNLDPAQMQERCPSARCIGISRLDGHRLAFTRKSINRGCGVADVVPAADESVWGVLFQILNAEDIPRLDTEEGYRSERPKERNAYIRCERDVSLIIGGIETTIRAAIYIGNPQAVPPLPNRAYREQLVSGARHWQLPEHYVQKLERIQIA